MTVLADVYAAIHHVIKPLMLIADGSKVNRHIQELEHEECIHWEQGRSWNSCAISRWPSVMTSWCSCAWKEKWTLSEPDSITPACHALCGGSGLSLLQQCSRGRLWVHIVWRFCHVPSVAPQRVPGHGTARRPRVSMDSLSSGFTLQLAKAVQINLPLGLETASVACWTVKF